VGFRWFVRERARALDLSGWVRNLPSGNVEIAARGSDEAIDNLIAAVTVGPPGAHVKEVIRRDTPFDQEYPVPFSVLR
jgi:acylphosphatase